jgi:hypothetical protein
MPQVTNDVHCYANVSDPRMQDQNEVLGCSQQIQKKFSTTC